MWSKSMRIGLIVIVIALLLGNLAVCVESTNDPQTKNPQKCPGSKPDECNGKCVNFQNDEKNCGSCGNACNQGEVCQNGKCVSGTSNKKATCTDGKKNGKETDVDCGGPTCPPCADEKTCKNGTDCSSGVCAFGFCQAPSCVDGVKNDNETGVDCGGPCPPCKRKPISGIGNITVLPVQNAPGTPAPTYLFVLDSANVGYTRSLNKDTDYASFGVAVANQIVKGAPKHRLVGDLSSGPYLIDLEIGPIPIPNDPNIPVTIGFLIVNSFYPADTTDHINTINNDIDAGTKALINSYSGSGSSLAFADKYLGDILTSYCDGTVAADKIVTNGQEIAQWTTTGSHSVFTTYHGTDSPIGCGSNSLYYVTWHVKKVS